MSASLADGEVCGPNLVDLLVAHIRAMEPFVHFLSRAIDFLRPRRAETALYPRYIVATNPRV